MDLKTLRVDSKKIANGVWCDIGGGTELLIARWNNPAYIKALMKANEPYKNKYKANALSEKQNKELLTDVIVETILLGWNNLKSDGVEIVYSREKAAELLNDDELIDFRELVVSLAQDEASFRKEDIEETAGKSVTI